MPNILRSTGNQTIKFGQLIDYNMRNIFFKDHTQNLVQKLVPDPFLKNENWAYLWVNWLKLQTFYFCYMPYWGPSKQIETILNTICIYLIWSFFKKPKRGLGLVSLAYFLHIFWRKMFLLMCSINWPIFTVKLALFFEILCNICIVTVC